jgi:hypothetical protein
MTRKPTLNRHPEHEVPNDQSREDAKRGVVVVVTQKLDAQRIQSCNSLTATATANRVVSESRIGNPCGDANGEALTQPLAQEQEAGTDGRSVKESLSI